MHLTKEIYVYIYIYLLLQIKFEVLSSKLCERSFMEIYAIESYFYARKMKPHSTLQCLTGYLIFPTSKNLHCSESLVLVYRLSPLPISEAAVLSMWVVTITNWPNLLCQFQALYSAVDACLVSFIQLDDESLQKQHILTI